MSCLVADCAENLAGKHEVKYVKRLSDQTARVAGIV